MADLITPDLLPGIGGSVIKKRLVDMGDGTFAEMTVATLAASANAVGTVNIGSLGGAATSANQTLGNATLATLSAPYATATSTPIMVTIADTATHTLGPFTPQLSREIWLTINATAAASGMAQLLRSTDAGTTKVGLTAGGQSIGAYGAPFHESSPCRRDLLRARPVRTALRVLHRAMARAARCGRQWPDS